MADKPGAPNQTLRLTRLFQAPRDRLFTAWTDPQALMDWFSPSNDYSTPSAEVDLRVGGRYRIQMKAADGSLYTVTGLYRDVRPPERLVFTWVPESPEGDMPETEVELLLQPDQGTTRLRLRHGPLVSKRQVETYRKTWKSTLDSLVLKLSEEGANN